MNQKKCIHCESVLTENKDTHGLVKWTKNEDGTINIHADEIIPVKVWSCDSCNHIDLYYFHPDNLQT